jgi:putative hydrolase of the HAD superfamily
MRDLIIFDGDDTLWRVEHLYDAARQRAAKIVCEVGIDPVHWVDVQKSIDVANVEVWGLSRYRFPLSSVMAYERVADEYGLEVDESIRARIERAAKSVFAATAPPMSAVRDTLSALSGTHRLALLTQGDPVVQEKRISESGLASFFEMIRVVSRKDGRSFEDLLDDGGVAACDAWSIGNSLPSDINPALRLGMRAIWIDAPVWEHEQRESSVAVGTAYTCSTLADVPVLVARQASFV